MISSGAKRGEGKVHRSIFRRKFCCLIFFYLWYIIPRFCRDIYIRLCAAISHINTDRLMIQPLNITNTDIKAIFRLALLVLVFILQYFCRTVCICDP